MSGIERTYWYSRVLADEDYSADDDERVQVPYERANLIGSKTPSGTHAPVLDLDFPARLMESSTPGHFHLFLDVEMTWEVYAALLVALAAAGVLEQGYVNASLGREGTFVRRNGVYKDTPTKRGD